MNNKRTDAAIRAVLGLIVVQSGVPTVQLRPPATTETPIKPLVGLLPLDPGLLVFGDRQSQEEKIRRINQIVLESSPSGAVISYIKGLYNGTVALPGARAVSDYVPAGWAPQSGFYRGATTA